MRRWKVMVVICALAFGSAAPGGAQTPPSTALSGPPEVLVLVYQQPGQGDLVDITYAHTVPHAQAERDIAALAQAAGWPLGPSRITDKAPPVQKKVGPMTGTSFIVPGAIQNETHLLPVEPFVTAFRSYKRLALIFSVGTAFQFQGPRNSADSNAQVVLEQRGTVYTYQVRVVNPQFTHLNLGQSQTASASAPPRPTFWVAFLGLFAAAGAAGVLVYVLMVRKNGPPAPPTNTESLAEEQTKIGVKG